MNFANKYRPRNLNEMIGHRSVVDALQAIAHADDKPHAYLFHGPAGVGKTSSARIVAKLLSPDASVLEVNAGDHTQVDWWRKLVGDVRTVPLDGDLRVIVVDECQALSAVSWKALLKPVEEPPPHVFWVFCTTDVPKVPNQIVSRCVEFRLGLVADSDIRTRVLNVVSSENIWSQWSDRASVSAAVDLVVAYAAGSPRQALTGLESVCGASSPDQVRDLLRTARPDSDVREFCRGLVLKQFTWAQAASAVRDFPEGTDPENVRHTLTKYTAAVVLSPKTSEARLPRLLAILQCFQEPYPDRATLAPLLVSLGRLFYGRK